MPRVLVVDDDMAILIAMQTWLDVEGYEVVIANNGGDGIAAISTMPFDVAVVDIFMPGMNGLETIMTFNRLAPGVPVIAISGSRLRNAAAPARDFPGMPTRPGAAFCLQKPFRPGDLVKVIESCLRGRYRVDVEILPTRGTGHS